MHLHTQTRYTKFQNSETNNT